PSSVAPVLAAGPNPRRGDLQLREGPTRCQIQGAAIGPPKGQVAHHFWRLDYPDHLARGRHHPDATRADAPHPPCGIDFEAIRNTGSRGSHLAKHPIIVQAAIRGHIKRPDATVGADLTPRFFLEAPLV